MSRLPGCEYWCKPSQMCDGPAHKPKQKECDHPPGDITWTGEYEMTGEYIYWPGRCKCGKKVIETYESRGITEDYAQDE